MVDYVDAEILPPVKPRRRRSAGLGCYGCPLAGVGGLRCDGCPHGMGQYGGGSYSYTAPGGQVVTMTWPAGGPLNWQDWIVAWIQQNPMLALLMGIGLGIYVGATVK